jgi:LCP family protein required for cell wall assembly
MPRMRRGRHRAPVVRSWAARAGLVFLVLFLAAGALVLYANIRINRIDMALPDRIPDKPMNVLILGSDSREGLSAEDQARLDPTGKDAKSGRRADTIVLVHIDEQQRKALVVHFPRDLKVTFPDGRTGKINGAYQKGPEAMVRTVEKVSGLPVHHYIEMNFVGFRNIVNALGGVDVYFEKSLKDKDSGLNVKKGCVELKGDQALAFVRVRKIDSDFGRIARQQLFARLVMDKVVSAGTLLNPVKVTKLVSFGASNITADSGLGPGDMTAIARRLRSFDPNEVDMRVYPSTPSDSFVYANQKEADALFTALREGAALPDYGKEAARNVDTGVAARPAAAPPATPAAPPVKPGDVSVSVLNGTPKVGVARMEANKLTAKGFKVIEVTDADSANYKQTVVFYRKGKEPEAKAVAALYGAQTKPVPATIQPQGDVALVMGARSGTPVPAATQAARAPTPPAAPPKPLIHAC